MELGFETDRLKTGTPARVDSRSVDFSGLERQPGDEDVRWFSFDPEVRVTPWLGVAAPLKPHRRVQARHLGVRITTRIMQFELHQQLSACCGHCTCLLA